MLIITDTISIPEQEVEFLPIRASGPGGQHVNKVSSAVHLRFDINTSSLPEHCKRRLLRMADRRITAGGIIVIKAGQFRSLEQNKTDALQRLRAALARTSIEGVATNLAFQRAILEDAEFAEGGVDTGFLARMMEKEHA